MSYQSLRQLREWGRLWKDVAGFNPTQVSQAPVAPVGEVNTPYESAVTAHGILSVVGVNLVQSLEWNYWPSLDPSDVTSEAGVFGGTVDALPSNYVWRIDYLIGRRTDGGIDPNLNLRPFPGAATADWFTTRIVLPVASSQLNPGRWITTDEAIHPFWLPHGGSISIGTLALNEEMEIRVLATGFLRGSTVSPG